MLSVRLFEVNPFGENTYVVWDNDSREAVVIDPGMSNDRERTAVADLLSREGLKVKAILLTHIHIDHTFGVAFLKGLYPDAEVLAHADDDFLGKKLPAQARMFHLPVEVAPLKVDRFIDAGKVMSLGDYEINALHAPGHSPGSLLYYFPSAGILFTGDVLFHRSIGRTDLEGGNHAQLLASINGKIANLPLSTTVYPGHGPATTISDELRFNPFL